MGRSLFLVSILSLFLASCGGPTQNAQSRKAESSAPKVIARVQTGAAPNDAILIEIANPPLLVVAASMDSSVQFFELPAMTPKGHVFFKPTAELVSPNPWALAATSDGSYVAVSLFDDHRVALIDVKTRKIVSTKGLPSEIIAKHPTSLKFVGNDLYVTFTNLQRFADFSGEASGYGPGVVARFSHAHGSLEYLDHVDLPCKNPSDLTFDDRQIAVSCAGSQYFDRDKNLQLHDGAAIVLLSTVDKLKVLSAVDLKHFSPSKIISHSDGFFCSSNLKRQVLFVPRGATSDDVATVVQLNDKVPDEVGYVSAMIKSDTDHALVADFRHDQIFTLDLKTRKLQSDAVLLQNQENPQINKGPLAMTMSQSGELFVVMAISAEILSVFFGGAR